MFRAETLAIVRSLATKPKFPHKFPLRLQRMPLVTISQSLDEAFIKHKIVPEVVPSFKSQVLMSIGYGKDRQVALGNELLVKETQSPPTIQIVPNGSGNDPQNEIKHTDRFILVLTDPDAPSNTDHKWSEYAHWLVTDLALKSSPDILLLQAGYELDFDSGKTLLSYVGPAPPENTGKHRYVFLLYKQHHAGQSAEFSVPSDRPTWGTNVPKSGVSQWIKENAPNLQLLGVNFFYAQNTGSQE